MSYEFRSQESFKTLGEVLVSDSRFRIALSSEMTRVVAIGPGGLIETLYSVEGEKDSATGEKKLTLRPSDTTDFLLGECSKDPNWENILQSIREQLSLQNNEEMEVPLSHL